MVPGRDSRPVEDVVTRLVVQAQVAHDVNIQPDDPLLSGNDRFDSFALMELVLRLEDTFDIHIPDQDLDLSIFHSVATLSAYVRVRLEGQD
jgi:acyl carrier protein